MYKRLDIELRPLHAIDEEDMDKFSPEIRKLVDAFHVKYKKHWKRRRSFYSYKITNRDELYEEFLAFNEAHKKELKIIIYAHTFYEQEDLDAAVAYIISCRNWCYYYDGYGEESYDYLKTASGKLGLWKPVPPIYIKLPSKTKKKFIDNYEVAITPNFEVFISPKLYTYLIEKGISHEFFREAYAKGNKDVVIAYRLWGEEHVLPPESYLPFTKDEYWCEDVETGNVKWVPIDDPDDIDECEFNFNGSLDFELEYLTKEGLELLTYVNDSFECFLSMRQTIVNKELFDLIAEKVPSIKKQSVPIFYREEIEKEYVKVRI